MAKSALAKYEALRDPQLGDDTDAWVYDAKLAERACQFFPRYLRLWRGEWSGKPFSLMPWQESLLSNLFGWVDAETGLTRRFRYCFVPIARGNGKSELASGVALYLFSADKEPGAEVYSAAADRQQASIVFGSARQMALASPEIARRTQVYRAHLWSPNTASVYRVLSSDAPRQHGLNPHGVIFDEVHTQKTPDLYEALDSALGKRRQPLMFSITTAGMDPQSLCWQLWDYAARVRSGQVDDPRFYSQIYAADPEDDIEDPAVWRKANPSLGVTVTEDFLRDQLRKAKEVPALMSSFLRLHLNIWTSAEERWLGLDVWDECAANVPDEHLEQRVAYAGLDLASTTDLSALVLVFPLDDGKVAVRPFFWVPTDSIERRARLDRVPYDEWLRRGYIEGVPGAVMDYEYIRSRLGVLRQRYDIREVAYDPWNAAKLTQELTDDGFTMVPIRQGFASLTFPTKATEGLILSRKLLHGGHPVLRWNAANAAVEQDAAGNLKLSKKKSRERIDGMVALTLAVGRMAAVADSVYAERGLMVLGG